MNKDIEIITVKALSDNYIWLLRNHSKKLTTVIDPSEAEPVEEVLLKNNWKLNQIVNTHHHYDHTNGNLKLKEKYGAVLIAPKLEQDKIQNIDHSVEDGDTIDIAGLPAKIIHTPGHTIGHIIYYLHKEKILFAGDTIFSLGCGRVFEGSMQDMYLSLEKIKNLDRKTTIYCGHEYTENNLNFALKVDPHNSELLNFADKILTQISKGIPTIPTILEDEINCNPFLRSDNPEIAKNIGRGKISAQETFKYLRKMKDDF